MPPTAPAPEAIFFDLDDTLLDDRAASSAGLRTMMERLGHPEFSAARRLWDVQTDISFNAYLAGRLTLDEQRRERVRALAVQAGHAHLADEHCDELYRLYLSSHRSAWAPFRDVTPMLGELARAGLRLGIITNGVEQLQRDKLAALDVAGFFPVVICADTAGAGKPDPRIFHTACQVMGVPPERAWHVGDQLRADALGAVSAGLHPVLIDRHDRKEGADQDVVTVTGLEELLHLVHAARTPSELGGPAGPQAPGGPTGLTGPSTPGAPGGQGAPGGPGASAGPSASAGSGTSGALGTPAAPAGPGLPGAPTAYAGQALGGPDGSTEPEGNAPFGLGAPTGTAVQTPQGPGLPGGPSAPIGPAGPSGFAAPDASGGHNDPSGLAARMPGAPSGPTGHAPTWPTPQAPAGPGTPSGPTGLAGHAAQTPPGPPAPHTQPGRTAEGGL